jgi:hypothetical protein
MSKLLGKHEGSVSMKASAYTKKDLIPVTMRMHAANNNWIKILGAAKPRSQALSSCGGKTLAGAGHVARGNLIAQGGVGKV